MILSAYVFPVQDRPIEGGLRGIMLASDVRRIALLAGSIPLVILIVLFGTSQRFRSGVAPWKAGLAAFLLGFALVAYYSLAP